MTMTSHIAPAGSLYQIYIRTDARITIVYFRTKEWAYHAYNSFTLPPNDLGSGLVELNKKRWLASMLAGEPVYKTLKVKTRFGEEPWTS